ncbi:MAG: hypothetical protein DCF17_16260 [Shackletoniella antarctica]|uniref:Uncharacterized protein n=1 Tax=Shackletoniella antarctica TaxID=268115 RepID=A0A2W4XRJ8_9CYAN|nr:MAG: hypothetical protein DCF17_16260 [Shackletoniella antarctica]
MSASMTQLQPLWSLKKTGIYRPDARGEMNLYYRFMPTRYMKDFLTTVRAKSLRPYFAVLLTEEATTEKFDAPPSLGKFVQ